MARRDRLIRESRHDPYEAKAKPAEPSACPRCHAVFRDGRWQWGHPPADAAPLTCPACQRTVEGMPGGILTLAGTFHRQHRDEILGLLRHVEERQARDHPLERIMEITEMGDEVEIRTCEARLARALGDAVHHAYQGELDYHYPGEGDVLRVRWER